MIKLSVIVPCYNESPVLELYFEELTKILDHAQLHSMCEVIFIDDGSTDGTLEIMRSLAVKNSHVSYHSFSRNFGKEAALLAGLRASSGQYVAVMDADLQDPPDLLVTMLSVLEQAADLDCVAARRVSRTGEPWLRSVGARSFYRLMGKISDTPPVDGARDYRVMTRRMVDSILALPEHGRFSKGIFMWVGYKTQWVEYEHTDRAAGATSWSLLGLIKYSFDGIVAFSTVPLAMSSWFGITACFVAFMAMLWIVLRALLWGDPVAGWPSLISVILLLGGLQLLSIGILGQYLAKVYLETKNRPDYFIQESNID